MAANMEYLVAQFSSANQVIQGIISEGPQNNESCDTSTQRIQNLIDHNFNQACSVIEDEIDLSILATEAANLNLYCQAVVLRIEIAFYRAFVANHH